MALEYHTGFDFLPTSGVYTALKQNGWTHSDGSSGTLATANVRNGTRSLSLTTAGLFLGMTGLSNAATRVLGCGLYLNSLAGNQRVIIATADGASPDVAANAQIGLAIDGTGHIQVRRGSALAAGSGGTGTLLGTSVNALVAATWQFIELVVTHHSSAGTVEVYVNGSKTGWLDLSGVNTQQTANAFSNAIGFGADATLGVFIDDVYTLTTTGAAPTARLGDCKSVVKFTGTDAALGVGTYTDSTPSTGTDQGAMVDDAPAPDDDTTYNAFTAAAQKDSYKTIALGLTGTIHAATVRARLRKSDAGDGSAQIGLRSSSLDDLSGDVFPSDASYQWFSRTYPTDPNTAAAWTIANLDAAQVLVKRTL